MDISFPHPPKNAWCVPGLSGLFETWQQPKKKDLLSQSTDRTLRNTHWYSSIAGTNHDRVSLQGSQHRVSGVLPEPDHCTQSWVKGGLRQDKYQDSSGLFSLCLAEVKWGWSIRHLQMCHSSSMLSTKIKPSIKTSPSHRQNVKPVKW